MNEIEKSKVPPRAHGGATGAAMTMTGLGTRLPRHWPRRARPTDPGHETRRAPHARFSGVVSGWPLDAQAGKLVREHSDVARRSPKFDRRRGNLTLEARLVVGTVRNGHLRRCGR